MRRFVAAARWEATIQARHRLYAVTLIVAAVWIGLLRLLPDIVRHQPASVVPMFVLVNLQITAFYFAAALVLLEKAQGVVASLLTSPLRPAEYVLAKGSTLALLGAVETLVIVVFVFGLGLHWGWLLAGTLLLGLLYVFVGLALVARHRAINTFLIPSIGWITLFTLPLLSVYDMLPWWMLAWHPMTPSLVLLEGSSRPISWTLAAFGMLGSVAWCIVAFGWARYRVIGSVAPSAG